MRLKKIAENVLTLVAVAATVATLINVAGELFSRKSDQEAAPTLEERIKTLTTSLNKSAATVQEIEKEMQDRQTLVVKLQRDAEIAQKLSALNKEQVDAVAQVIRGQIVAQEHSSFWGNQALAIFYTLLGVALAELTRLFLRWRARRKLAQGTASMRSG